MSQPNLLVILSDQHHSRVMGHAGDEVVQTPHLDALAAEGIRFSQAYCAAPLCVPSRMTFLTSRHCSNIGVWTNQCTLRSDIATFAHSLGAAGYETVLCGRMHFEGPDQRHGFERRLIGDFTPNYPGLGGVPLTGLPGGTGQHRRVVLGSGPGRTAVQAYDAAVTDAACRFIADRDPDDRPWCMVVGYYLPHCPFICPRPYFEHYYDRVSVPELPPAEVAERHPAIHDWCAKRELIEPLSEQQIRTARAAYYGLVSVLDENVGRVLAAVDSSQARDRTVRVYLSDHGEMAGEHGMWWKSNFYEGSVGVPMIWSWPDAFDGGVVRDQIVSLLDIGPTLEELAGQVAAARPMDGRSLVPLLTSGQSDVGWPNEVMAELRDGRMIRRGPWKLNIYHGYDLPQLFNLASDPGERHDRTADPSCASIRRELLDRLCADWQPEAIAQQLDLVRRNGEVLAQWARVVHPPQHDLWQAPPGVNRFPEA